MQKPDRLALGSMMLLTAMGSAYAASATMIHTPSNFQVMSVSANGNWACGVFMDAYTNTYSFRWNLLSDRIEVLDAVNTSVAFGISNDGIVSGEFNDPNVLSNHAPIPMPGYYRDGKWNSVEYPSVMDSNGGGTGYGISPDGQYMVGSVLVNNYYHPFIWKNGEVYRDLGTGNHAMAYAVAPDGTSAAGWSAQHNRTACIWHQDNSLEFMMDSPDYSQSPWNCGKNYSADGKKLLYWGGWEVAENGEDLYLYCLYDIESGEKTKVKAPSMDSDLEFFGISNSGTIVGQNKSRGYVYHNGEGMYIDDYMQLRGVDLSQFDNFYYGSEYTNNNYPITNVVSISADDSVLAMLYWDPTGQQSSLIVKIDQDLSNCPPTEFKARQLDGLQTVALTWQAPVGITGIRGYNVYRDGKKLNGFLPLNALSYYDSKLEPGTYTYVIGMVNGNGTETRTDEFTIEVKGTSKSAPQSIFGRQRGFNGAQLSWDRPQPNKPMCRYYTDIASDIQGLNVYESVPIQAGIRVDRAELNNYAGHKIDQVSFMPMSEQDGWTVKVYSLNNDGSMTQLVSQPVTQPLEYRKRNTVVLNEPIDLPGTDIIVAIEASVNIENPNVIGAQSNHVEPGYSDLLRQVSEDSFYSMYDSSVASGYSIACMTWAIDFTLVNSEYADDNDTIDHYDVYADGVKAGETTGTTYDLAQLGQGSHSLGVVAVYNDNSQSELVGTAIEVVPSYKPVTAQINVGSETPTVTAQWQTPYDNDMTEVKYFVNDKRISGIKGVADNGYALIEAVEYDSSMLRGYDGYVIGAINFYPLADAIYTVYIYQDDKMVYEYEVEDFEIGKWNHVELPDELVINETSKYRIAVDCFDPVPDTNVFALDTNPGFSFKSDLYSLDNGENWNSISFETGANGSWLLSMSIYDRDGGIAPIDGYDMIIDGKKVNTEIITDTEYTHVYDNYDEKRHTLSVNTHYTGYDPVVNGERLMFILSASGINDAMVGNVELVYGNDRLTVRGENVSTVGLYNANGSLVASVNGDTVNTDSLPNGIYVVTATVNGHAVTYKVLITK